MMTLDDFGSLPSDDATAMLVALLRARPDEAVRAMDDCKVAGPWAEKFTGVRSRHAGGSGWLAAEVWEADVPAADFDGFAARTVDSDGDGWEGDGYESFEAAMAAADAALVAGGWVLAGGGR